MNEDRENRFEHMAMLLRVLGHPARLAMVEELKKRSWCVCELAAKLDLNNPTASKHLSLLKSVGVVEMEKDGTRVNCTLAMPCVVEMMHCANMYSEGTTAGSEAGAEADEANNATSCCSIPKERG
ncbi:MAG: ArsR/SmtB family transcription factor [Spirochaetota bacterium]